MDREDGKRRMDKGRSGSSFSILLLLVCALPDLDAFYLAFCVNVICYSLLREISSHSEELIEAWGYSDGFEIGVGE